jgi:UDP-2,3-diacylglucosamine pyrophosphatase LpxH
VSRTIIVSDLHIDTWNSEKLNGKTRKEHFFDLLDWCEQTKIREFVINGDLINIPPYVGQTVFNETTSLSRDVVERLVKFAANVPVTYIFGNHDIGISGFRCMGEYDIAPLRNINFCYPDYVIDDYPDTTILIQHGHFCDPALILYMRDLADRTYRPGKLEELQWMMQRRKRGKPAEDEEPGALSPVSVKPGENAYHAAKQGQKPLPKASIWSKIKQFLWTRGADFIAGPTMEWWWKSAVEDMDKYITSAKSKGEIVKANLYQIYGHTHRADPRDPVKRGNTACFYINAGTWTRSAKQGWYLDVDNDGKIWLQDWINEPESLRRL